MNGPDYNHSGEFIDWGDVPLDDRFAPLCLHCRESDHVTDVAPL